MLRIAAIIPVKSFSKAKSRLDIPSRAKRDLCAMMLDEMLHTLSASPQIARTVVVTGDREARDIASWAGADVVDDPAESGVNDAVALADAHVTELGIGATVVLPQDIPFTTVQDIGFLLRNQIPPDFVTIVPSRRFDGTNALFRMPPDIIRTSYDQDSYRAHVESARRHTRNPSVLFVPRMMADIDDVGDLRYVLGQNANTKLCGRIMGIDGMPDQGA